MYFKSSDHTHIYPGAGLNKCPNNAHIVPLLKKFDNVSGQTSLIKVP